MKSAFSATTIALTIFCFGHAETSQQEAQAYVQYVNNSQEREILLYNCSIIKAQVDEYFCGMNAYNSSGRVQMIQQRLTQYLHSVNSPEAWKILREMQANNFANWR